MVTFNAAKVKKAVEVAEKEVQVTPPAEKAVGNKDSPTQANLSAIVLQ